MSVSQYCPCKHWVGSLDHVCVCVRRCVFVCVIVCLYEWVGVCVCMCECVSVSLSVFCVPVFVSWCVSSNKLNEIVNVDHVGDRY